MQPLGSTKIRCHVMVLAFITISRWWSQSAGWNHGTLGCGWETRRFPGTLAERCSAPKERLIPVRTKSEKPDS